MQGIALGLTVLVVAACGGGGGVSATPVPTGFPENVPTVTDGECSEPRTDPARPRAGPLGKVTDGVTVERVNVVDGGPGEVVVTFTVSSPPYVTAASGERWIVATLGGVRRFWDATVNSLHARRLPATICDDSAWVFALAFDREVGRLVLENEREPKLRVFLKS